MKNSKKNVATNKKAYQAALIKKATAKKTNATPAVDSVNTDNISTTTDTAPVRKVNDKALRDALAYLLSNYPAIETTRKSDFKHVFNMLLKLNVDLTSKKDISAETERILNILGFTNNKHNVTKEFICKYDILSWSLSCSMAIRRNTLISAKLNHLFCLNAQMSLMQFLKNFGILLSCTLHA